MGFGGVLSRHLRAFAFAESAQSADDIAPAMAVRLKHATKVRQKTSCISVFFAGLALACGLVTASYSSAEARSRHHSRGHHVKRHAHGHSHAHGRRAGGGPPYSAIVVDANSGETLYGQAENELRHPASVTKVMTLYLLFEQLEKGRYQLDTRLTMSAHAASMAPSKLGVRPGGSIEVEDAIKAIVTKSANDVASAIAENIGGSEERFAAMMTRKARALGMRRTVYRNASGLPNPQQITTAHDLAILGRAIQDRFPRYYKYFSTRNFYWAGRPIQNHNHLLGRVEGVDGIKTGYTAASGFNLLTSVRRDGRHLVAVVMGGRSAGSRDRAMVDLISENLSSASRTRTAMAITESPDGEIDPVAASEPGEAPAYGIQLASAQSLAYAPILSASAPTRSSPALTQIGATPAPSTSIVTVQEPSPVARPVGLELAVPASPAPNPSNRPRPGVVSNTVLAMAPDDEIVTGSILPAPAAAESRKLTSKPRLPAATTPKPTIQTVTPNSRSARAAALAAKDGPVVYKPGWIIQIGAAESPIKAAELLNRAKAVNPIAASAQTVTEKVQKGHETLWRARFAGLKENLALSACRDLKKSGFSCFTMKN